LQDPNNTRPTKEAKAQNDLARPIKEAKALDVKTDSKNTIIVHILKGSFIEGKSRTIYTNFTSRIDLTALRKKDKIKAKKANRAKLRD
jgi:hypothetical protein